MFLIAILAVSTISVVTAADITINSTTPGGIKAAVGSAKDGDTIFLKDGVYKGKDNAKISISKSITIKGLGSNVVLDGEGKNRIFTIRGNKILLKKLQLRQGYTKHHGGIILHKKGSLILNNCIFNNNKADKYGGSVNSEKKTSLVVTNCIFSNNEGVGAISTLGKLNISNCTFTNNKDGGAISAWGLTVVNSTFTNNKAEYDGGAISTFSKSTIINCNFKNNHAKGDGGAIYQSTLGSLTVKNSTFTTNRAEDGGAIYTFTKTTVSNCTFTNNQAKNKDGGAIDFLYDHSSVNSCTFKNNQAKRNGGAICIGIHTGITGTVKVADSKFTKNIAGNIYNAIYAYKGSKFTEKNVSITPKFGTKVKK